MKHLYPCLSQFINVSKKASAVMAVALLTGFYSFSQTSIPELVFKNSTISSGQDGKDGAVYKFANVSTGIDALVKINGRSSNNVELNDIDINNTGYDNAFQPLVNYTGGDKYSANTVTDWYMEFQVSFVQHGTATPTTVSGFDVTGLDDDGNTALHEYLSFYSLKTFTLENPTDITVTDLKNGPTVIGNRYDGSTTEYSGIDPTATRSMVTNHYGSINSFVVRVGGLAKGPINISNNGRQYSLWFKSFTYNSPVVNTLPVSLLSFNAALNTSSKVSLDWVTSEEIKASHFVVQRSTDGSEFNDEAVIFTDGENSYIRKKYDYTDNISTVSSSLVYYRLKMVDLDGSYRYSEVAVIRLGKQDGEMAIVTYPNPAVNQIRVTIPNDWQNKSISYSIYNLNGSLVKQKFNGSAGQTETFNIADLPLGLYIIKAANGNETSAQKFLKIL